MAAAPPTNNGPSFHSQSIHSHRAIAGPSTGREVVTAPRTLISFLSQVKAHRNLLAWAHDEPPSPTELPVDNKRRNFVSAPHHHRPSHSISSLGGAAGGTENRSRWWTFARPRDGTMNSSRYSSALAALTVSQRDSSLAWKEKDSMDDPSVQCTPPKPSHPKSQAAPDRNSPWKSSIVYRQGNRGDYAQLGCGSGPPHDDESGAEGSTLENPRKGFRFFILSNIYVPLVRVSQTRKTIVLTAIPAFSIH